jgi:hypothetical protein
MIAFHYTCSGIYKRDIIFVFDENRISLQKQIISYFDYFKLRWARDVVWG